MSAFLGVDQGQAQDPTAWALSELKKYVRKPPLLRGPYAEPLELYGQLHCTAYSRFALRTPYTEIVRKLAAIVAIPELYRDVTMIVDCTRERAVYDMIRESGDFHGVVVIPIVITSGTHVTVDEYAWYKVPEAEIASALTVLLEGERLKTFRDGGQEKGDADEMDRQLSNLKRRTSRKRYSQGMTVDGTDAAHDDMAFALAFTAWYVKYTGVLEMPRPAPVDEKPYNPATFKLTDGG